MILPDWSSLQKAKGGKLPHWTCNYAIYHVCFRLADSIPPEIQKRWNEEKKLYWNSDGTLKRFMDPDGYKRLKFLFSEKINACLDAGYGECLLKNPKAAGIVKEALGFFDGKRYRLHAWSIMPNHVHVIAEPLAGFELSKIIHSWKSFTANQINRELNRKGTLWQRETYDHIIRTEAEYRDQIDYVWNNPVKAGLRNCLRWRIEN